MDIRSKSKKEERFMDYDKIMEIFDAALSFLTKLLIGVGALDADKEPPYKPYLDDAKGLVDAIKTAMDK